MKQDDELRLQIIERLIVLIDRRNEHMSQVVDSLTAEVATLKTTVAAAIERINSQAGDNASIVQATADVHAAVASLDAVLNPPAGDSPPAQ
jgi:hypothetical protein